MVTHCTCGAFIRTSAGWLRHLSANPECARNLAIQANKETIDQSFGPKSESDLPSDTDRESPHPPFQEDDDSAAAQEASDLAVAWDVAWDEDPIAEQT